MKFSWTQPCCTQCWFDRHPDRTPVRVVTTDYEDGVLVVESCVYCDRLTLAGIFVRINPEQAPYPSRLKDD